VRLGRQREPRDYSLRLAIHRRFCMLVLSRKNQESVVVGGTDNFEHVLKVTVLEILGNKVRLGFDVAKDVPVHRLEVWERICASARIENSDG
jgi:carbon storage regulator